MSLAKRKLVHNTWDMDDGLQQDFESLVTIKVPFYTIFRLLWDWYDSDDLTYYAFFTLWLRFYSVHDLITFYE